jgi:hypothetical protein
VRDLESNVRNSGADQPLALVRAPEGSSRGLNGGLAASPGRMRRMDLHVGEPDRPQQGAVVGLGEGTGEALGLP